MPHTDQTVYVVDDDDDVRMAIVRALVLRGFSVEGYSSATEFLDKFDPTKKGCLVLDQGMPNMTGLELQEILVKRGHKIPTIFITGHGGVSHSVQAMKFGALDFLEKPVPQALLLERINTALEANVG